MTLAFAPATKTKSRLRMALIGPSGSGKTYTALAIASALGNKIAVIDTERGSASKYAGDPFVFDTLELETYEPLTYVEAITAAEAAGYDVLIVDSLSHAWSGKGGALDQVDRRSGANKFAAWREVTPMHNALVDAILGSSLHVIATMRSKTEYAVEQDGGKTKVVKLGLAPVQRDGVEYEFDVIGDLDQRHVLRVTKTRCRALDDAVIPTPGAGVAETLKAWLTDGAEPKADTPPDPPGPKSATATVSHSETKKKPATAAERKELDTVIELAQLKDPERDWNDTVDKFARREFGHGVGALTGAEVVLTVKHMTDYLAGLGA